MFSHCCNLPKFRPVSHVIFDLDGTLIDSEKIYQAALKKAVELYGKTWIPECQQKIAGHVMEISAQIAVESYGIDCTSQEFYEKLTNLADEGLKNIDLMPGAERLIRHLHSHNIPMAIATSSHEEKYKMKVEPHVELFALFRHVVCGGTDPMVKNSKPAPDIFLVCASRFPDNPKPEKCLVFEDSYAGMKGALAAGMQVVMIPEVGVPYDMWKDATLRINSLNYMIPQLFQLPPFPPEDHTFPMEIIKLIESPKDSLRENNKNVKEKKEIIETKEENKKDNEIKKFEYSSDALDINREENKYSSKNEGGSKKRKKSGGKIKESKNERINVESDAGNEADISESSSANNNKGNNNDDHQPNDRNKEVAAQ